MNTKLLLAPLALLSAWSLPSQEVADQEKPLSRVPSAADYAEGWAQGLRSAELPRRREAYAEVLAGAERSPAVRKVVEGWMQGEDLELAWTAELLLREIDTVEAHVGNGSRGLGRRGGSLFPFSDGHAWGRDALPGFDISTPEELFRQLDEMFEDPFGGGSPFQHPIPGPLGGGQPGVDRWSQSTSQGLTLKTGPEGVKVEVREMENGDEKIRTYEAESIEALLEAHPELEDRLGRGGPGSGMPGMRGLIQTPFTDRGGPPVLLRPSEMRTDILGVQVRARSTLPSGVPELDGLPDGVGLEVLMIYPGTLGEALGLVGGEFLVEINGREIRVVDDVKRTLAQRTWDQAVEVEVVDRNGQKSTLRWEPPARGGEVF